MSDCAELLRDSIRNAHEISQLLRPTVLDDFGLDSALAWLCERCEGRSGINVHYLGYFHDRLEEQTETHVFRIAQEALTNVVRHARASTVNVSLCSEDNLVRLEISDNGIGLPLRKEVLQSSFGLTGMRARARILQGDMYIDSPAGHGTTLRVTFPLRDKRDEKENQNLVS
jgi:signal transduction histidine kinase